MPAAKKKKGSSGAAAAATKTAKTAKKRKSDFKADDSDAKLPKTETVDKVYIYWSV